MIGHFYSIYPQPPGCDQEMGAMGWVLIAILFVGLVILLIEVLR